MQEGLGLWVWGLRLLSSVTYATFLAVRVGGLTPGKRRGLEGVWSSERLLRAWG